VNLVDDLTGAAERGELVALYQPQFDIATGRLVGVEALARWIHPNLGVISPEIFVPLAEKHGLIAGIGNFMIDAGCRCASVWNALDRHVDVAVNVSAAQLLTLDFLDRVADDLANYAMPADQLVIEITESLPIVDVAEVTDRLVHLRRLGLGISIDDFGTGYSSFDRLTQLPATEMKLDRSVIQGDGSYAPSIYDAVHRARELGIRVVAEGVETREQLARARRLGCERAQGFLFSPPITEFEVGQLLATG
jgi:EAL domain-containing protein (putative c-di-GMP-specific phosphodiesterase class I)